MSAVIVVLLMFSAVIATVKEVDKDRHRHAILASDSREMKDRIGLQTE